MRADGYAKAGVQSEFAAEARMMEELLLDQETELEGQYQRREYPPARGACQFYHSAKQLYEIRDKLARGMLWPTKSSNHNLRLTRGWWYGPRDN
jgi:hypothetical protein